MKPFPKMQANMTAQARFGLLWTLAVIAAAAAFCVHLALRFENVRLGYEVTETRNERERLIETSRLLTTEAATLRSADRVEAVARGTLNMSPPRHDEVFPVGGNHRAVSGRIR